MTPDPHAKLEARRRRTHTIRTTIAAIAVAVFVAVFATVYVQMAAGKDPALGASVLTQQQSTDQSTDEPAAVTTAQS